MGTQKATSNSGRKTLRKSGSTTHLKSQRKRSICLTKERSLKARKFIRERLFRLRTKEKSLRINTCNWGLIKAGSLQEIKRKIRSYGKLCWINAMPKIKEAKAAELLQKVAILASVVEISRPNTKRKWSKISTNMSFRPAI